MPYIEIPQSTVRCQTLSTRPKNIPRRGTPNSISPPALSPSRENVLDNYTGLEKKSGNLYITRTDPVTRRTHNIPVVVKVYTSTYDHYAVVYPDKLCSSCGYINLKNCALDTFTGRKCGFKLIPNDCDGKPMTFLTNNPAELEDWVEACTPSDPVANSRGEFSISSSRSPSIPHSPLMPTLQEDNENSDTNDEEEEDDDDDESGNS